jgi:CIC family chloride channel protein
VTGRLLVDQFQKLSPRTRAVVQTCLYGLAAGAIAAAFQLAISWIYNSTIVRLSQEPVRIFLSGSFVVMIGTSLVSGFLMNSYCQEAAGSGIPQLKIAFWKDFGFVSWRAVWVKFIAGALAIGGGSSLGREGPSVYVAGGLASNLAGLLGDAKQRRRNAAATGAAAGLAAAFNAPLAAFTFVLEEIIGDLNSRFLGSVVAASVLGALVVHGLIGRQPAFKLATIDAPGWKAYLLIPLVAVLAALVGSVFQKLTLELRAKQKRMTAVPGWMRPSLGAAIAWLLGVIVFVRTNSLGVFSLGYNDLTAGLNNQVAWDLAGLLLITKLFATISCYGFGGCGGIFSPTLFFGGMCGIFVGGLSAGALHLSPSDQITLAVVGMSACLGSVVRAPVTGILVVFEMTHQFSLVPGLMLGALISQAVARRLANESLYDELILQDGHHLEKVIPPRDLYGWRQLPVSAIANFSPVIITDLAPAALKEVLPAHPYQRFPVVKEDQLAGILTRQEAEAAIAENRPPKLQPAVTCLPTQTIGDLQRALIDSTTLLVVVVADPNGKVLGLISIHDVLRAEAALARGGEE